MTERSEGTVIDLEFLRTSSGDEVVVFVIEDEDGDISFELVELDNAEIRKRLAFVEEQLDASFDRNKMN